MKLNIILNGLENKKDCANYPRPLKIECETCEIFKKTKDERKRLCKNCQIPYIESMVDIPVQKNGFVLTGQYTSKKCLVVLDFDNANKLKINVDDIKKILKIKNTLTVETGSHGYHFYFWLNDDKYLILCAIRKQEELTKEIKDLGITGVDIRGVNGIVFAPGCSFKDHSNNPYKIIDNSEILDIDEVEMAEILNSVLDKHYLDNIYVLKNNGVQKTINENKTITKDVNIVLKRMRHGFKDIWNGSFLIEHLTQSSTGKSELKYWSAFWREFIVCGGKIDDAIAHFRKALTQPEFDEEKTLTGLRYLKYLDRRPSMDEYIELFPQYENEQKMIRLNNKTDILMQKCDKIIQCLKGMGVWKDE